MFCSCLELNLLLETFPSIWKLFSCLRHVNQEIFVWICDAIFCRIGIWQTDRAANTCCCSWTSISTSHRLHDYRRNNICETDRVRKALWRVTHFPFYTVSEKDCTLFLFFFSRCPVCGEWCKLHWLLLDTPSFDWNTRLSRGHKMFKMAPTKQQKAFCVVEYAKTTSGAFAFA